ncbi:MAG: class I SAM-dependent methyltransferase [Nitrospirae bacterium]|nr:class I SAM-dependent methyltransferase [Nitrospirota bacterium]
MQGNNDVQGDGNIVVNMADGDGQPRCGLCGGPMECASTRGLYVCNSCHVAATWPQVSGEELAALYGTYRNDVSGTRFVVLIEYFIRLFRYGRKRKIEKYVKKGKILDVGCGRGLFLHVMERGGWSVFGVEYDEETAVRVSRAYGIRVVAGSHGDWGFEPGSFDCVALFHVLEHLREPMAVLETCRNLLKPGGVLYVSVPNWDSLQAKAGKDKWFHLDLPYHLYHFTEKGLIKLIGNCGLEILEIRRFDLEYAPYGWLQTLLNLSGTARNLLYDALRRPIEALKGPHRGGLFLSLALLPIYVPLSLMLSLVESYTLKMGGIVDVVAVKKE